MRIRLLEPWRSRLLWASLGANLFAVALMAAPFVAPRRPPGPPSFDRLVERMAGSLPPADGAAFRDAMARERPWYDMSRRTLGELRAVIGQQIGQVPFDPAATRAAMSAMQARLHESATRFDDSLVLALSSISAEGRAKLSADMARRRPPGERP